MFQLYYISLVILNQVLARRLVTLRGPRGIGKSAFVAHLAAYLSDRRHFPVFVIDLHHVRSIDEVRCISMIC
jgi:MoxR-like ATPase